MPDCSWIGLCVFLDGHPDHDRGIVCREAGLYFVGLPFLFAMSSGFRGVSRDAAFVAARHRFPNRGGERASPDYGCAQPGRTESGRI